MPGATPPMSDAISAATRGDRGATGASNVVRSAVRITDPSIQPHSARPPGLPLHSSNRGLHAQARRLR